MNRKRVQKTFIKPSLTKQSFGPTCDINRIVRNFTETGSLPVRRDPPQYGVGEADFQEAQFALASAKSSFEALDPAVRRKYGDLYAVLRAMEDPARAAELASDGILYTTEGDTPSEPTQASTEETTPPADTEQSDGGEATPTT